LSMKMWLRIRAGYSAARPRSPPRTPVSIRSRFYPEGPSQWTLVKHEEIHGAADRSRVARLHQPDEDAPLVTHLRALGHCHT
jgi:hypothetical protein